MKKYKKGELMSGGRSRVKSREQAIAIGLSEARKKGAKVPSPKTKGRGGQGSSRKSQSSGIWSQGSRSQSRGASSQSRTGSQRRGTTHPPTRTRQESSPRPRPGSSRLSNVTTDHEFIRQWSEDRGGWPAKVKGTGGDGDPGILRIDFPGYSGEEDLERLSWEEFFDKFEKSNFAFLYQEKSSRGQKSRFNKLIKRDPPR